MVAASLALCLILSPASDRDLLLQGVELIASPGIPGVVVPFGARSVTLAVGRSGEQVVPVVAAGRSGRGRVVLFGHNGYLNAYHEADSGKLLANAARWVARGRALVVAGQPGLARHLNVESADEWTNLDPHRHALVIDAHQIGAAQVGGLRKFVREGGGLVTAATGWGWQQIEGGKPLTEFPANLVLADAGLVVTGGMADPAEGGSMRADRGEPHLLHAGRALERLASRDFSRAGEDGSLVTLAASSLPDSATSFQRELRRVEAGTRANLTLPIGEDRPLDRLVMALMTQRASSAPVEKVTACPTSGQFPGNVPSDATPGKHVATLPANQEGWLSTGLYAPAGVPVVVDLAQGGWTARIGSHTDGLWHHARWDRAPEVSRLFALQAGRTTIASAHGGLVYLIPPSLQASEVQATLEGVVPAPRFVRGRTTDAEWRATRSAPGPWAEIEGDRVIHTIPSAWVRDLDNPAEVAEFWDSVTDACADLAQRPRERQVKERIVADVQIGGGYMHSGYPIMTHLDTRDFVLDLEKLRRDGSWGHFHELGHNHQSDLWTFEGTGEVTVNLFTLFIYDNVLGHRPPDRAFDQAYNRKQSERFQAEGWAFDRWQSDPFMALTSYMELQNRFGWEAFQRVFAEYRDLPATERPSTDQEKRDQWLVRFSRAVGVNLAPQFQLWRIPVSESAVRQIANLPTW